MLNLEIRKPRYLPLSLNFKDHTELMLSIKSVWINDDVINTMLSYS